jgi:hypothetical protein
VLKNVHNVLLTKISPRGKKKILSEDAKTKSICLKASEVKGSRYLTITFCGFVFHQSKQIPRKR